MVADENDPLLISTGSGKPLFDAEDKALLFFLKPRGVGNGPSMLIPYLSFHDKNAGDFSQEIINLIEQGKTVIIDLGNANPIVMEYFSEYLCREIFKNQVDKFSQNTMGSHYIQLYFEEAHNLFPVSESDNTNIYQRLAKEGAKYHIGMTYATQSPSTINKDLIAQTENFFIVHLSSQPEVDYLSKVNIAFEQIKDDILCCKTVGHSWMLTRSHRFVIPIYAKKFQ
jgi:DNA helicase HerA-like ATPase